jgi:nitroimidazol reductase NimA-like FMN-containing flavoprotein (pyridoxamine 5'-phosphate oxidase superfamily)
LTGAPDLAAVARGILDANRYMTLATADGGGRPWATPVWFAHNAYTELLWVSRPDARHSVSLGARPEVGVVIFDSTVEPGGAQAAYVEAEARELSGDERDSAIEVYSRRSQAQGLGEWTAADVVAPRAHRLYRAVALRHFVLEANDQRTPVQLGR